jgi:hypothetical protein
MKKTILIYEPDCEQVPHLVFLLHLAGICGTHARTVEEAMNWLAAHRLQVITFDLLLICSFCRTEPEHQLLRDLPGLALPVVFLQRDNRPSAHLPAHTGIICHPDDLLDRLRDCLTATTCLPKERAL